MFSPTNEEDDMAHERRRDDQTSSNIRDALMAQGSCPSALAMVHQRVQFETALRVLTRPGDRRKSGGR
jgi:hypothetical protein